MSAADTSEGGRRYHHGNLREALIAEALTVLETQAQGEVSLRELARRVGVSPNAAYRHFPDKEALLTALAAHGFNSFAAQQEAAFRAAGDSRTGLRDMGRVYVRFARANPALFRLMFGRFSKSEAVERDEAFQDACCRAIEGLRQAVMRAAGAREADEMTVRVFSLRVWSLVHGLSMLILDGQVAAEGEELEQLIAAVVTPDNVLQAKPSDPGE